MKTTHEQTIESHVMGNLAYALDQMASYESTQDACDACAQNTYDSCLCDGYTNAESAMALDWFISLFREAAGLRHE